MACVLLGVLLVMTGIPQSEAYTSTTCARLLRTLWHEVSHGQDSY
jgi:hypothetical protein